MGDADCTYDFRELAPFVEALRDGRRVRHGLALEGHRSSRARCRALHHYFGTPVTTWILNRLYGSHFSRHPLRHARHHAATRSCGWASRRSRGSTPPRWCSSRCAWSCAPPRCRSRFLKDREGRLCHHKRAGWFSPFAAAWINLRAMFVYGADFFLFKPGHRPARARAAADRCRWRSATSRSGQITFSLYSMLVGVALAVIGLQSIYFGCLAHVFLDYGGRRRETLATDLPLHPDAWSSSARPVRRRPRAWSSPWWSRFVSTDFALPAPPTSARSPRRSSGCCCMIIGFSTFCFTLLLHATAVSYGADRADVTEPADGRTRLASARTATSPSSTASASGCPSVQIRRASSARWPARTSATSAAASTRRSCARSWPTCASRDARRPGARRRPRRRTRRSARSRARCPRRSTPSTTARSTSSSACRCSSTCGSPTRTLAQLRRVLAPGGVLRRQRAVVARQAGPRVLRLPARPLARRGDGRPQDVLRPARPLAAAGARRASCRTPSGASGTSSASTRSRSRTVDRLGDDR